MVIISGMVWLLLVLVIFVVAGMTTKKWNKASYLLSGLLFLIGIIAAVKATDALDGVKQATILFGIGFLVNSLGKFFTKK